MDQHPLDRLARALAPTSRRTVLGAAAATGFGLRAVPAAAQTPDAATPVAGSATPVADPANGQCQPALVTPFQGAAYADTVWPTEHRDPWRTHAATGGLPAAIREQGLTNTSIKLPAAPTWGYVGADGLIYVVGGSPFLLDVFTSLIEGAPRRRLPALARASKQRSDTTTPYIARIDPATLTVEHLTLDQGISVNYIGGLLMHVNGSIYAVARGFLYQIDPATFTITNSTFLPLVDGADGNPNGFTTYNGMQATADGDLILKGWPSVTPDAPGILLRVDPDTLTFRTQLITDLVGAARLTIVQDGDSEYLYHPGKTQSMRFILTRDAFTLDEAWSVPYLAPDSGQSEASSHLYMGAGVVFSDNTTPAATTPMTLFAQAAATIPGQLAATPAFASDAAGWNFFMVAGDPFATGIVVVGDQLNGQLAAYRVCAGGGELVKVWETDRYAISAGAAIAWERGHLYIDDRRCDSNACTLYLVVLDLVTGEHLAEVEVAGAHPSIGQIFIGPDNDVYFPATEANNPTGYLNRIAITPA